MVCGMTHLYLIRHCETRELAGEEPAHPRGDSDLSSRGEAQAQQLRAMFSPWPVELFLTSLFRRAQQTAAILNIERAVPVFGSIALNEFQLRDTGEGVESLEQGLVRAIGFLNQFRAYHSRVAVVAHNSILSVIRMSLLNAPFEPNARYFASPGQACVLRYDPGAGDQNWREVASYHPHV